MHGSRKSGRGTSLCGMLRERQSQSDISAVDRGKNDKGTPGWVKPTA